MDSTTVLIIAIFVGAAILGIVLKAVLYKGYDKVRNDHIKRKNTNNPPEKTKLSDIYNNHGNK